MWLPSNRAARQSAQKTHTPVGANGRCFCPPVTANQGRSCHGPLARHTLHGLKTSRSTTHHMATTAHEHDLVSSVACPSLSHSLNTGRPLRRATANSLRVCGSIPLAPSINSSALSAAASVLHKCAQHSMAQHDSTTAQHSRTGHGQVQTTRNMR